MTAQLKVPYPGQGPALAVPQANPTQPSVLAVAITDGEGNLNPAVALASTAAAPLAFFPGAQAVSNAGTSFSTLLISALAVDITLTSFTGGTAPTVTFFVDRLGNDSLWYRIWTSAALNGAGVTSANIGPGLTGTGTAAAVLTGTGRFGWSSTGAPTAITFSASVAGR
jgi:hypothetical protein